MKCINFYFKESNTFFFIERMMKAIGKNSSRPPYPFLLSEKKKKKKAFEKIMERLMLQAGDWEINSYVNYFPAVFY